jgi:hypothetical protein
MARVRQAAVAAAPFVLAVLGYVLAFSWLGDRLPGELATHFGAGGRADGTLGRTAVLWAGVGVQLGMGLLFAVLTPLAPAGSQRRLMAAVGGSMAALLGYLLTLTLFRNADAASPAEVTMPMWHLAVALGLAAAVGTLCALASGGGGVGREHQDPSGAEPAAPAPAASLSLAPGESAAWSRAVGSRALLATAAVTAAGAVGLGLAQQWGAAAVTLVAAFLTGGFGSVRVTVDRRGIAVGLPLVARPRLRVPMDRIVAAGTRQVRPLADFGGWGYRVRPGARGVVLRSGEALSARLTGGGEFVVTVNDSTTAASLLNGLLERERGKDG